MKDCNLKEVLTPVEKITDPLTELLRNGARDLIRQAVEAELCSMLYRARSQNELLRY